MKLVFFYKRILKLLNKAQFNVVSYFYTQFKKLKQQNKHKNIDTYKNQIYNICERNKIIKEIFICV